jgi:hypothetical protein
MVVPEINSVDDVMMEANHVKERSFEVLTSKGGALPL